MKASFQASKVGGFVGGGGGAYKGCLGVSFQASKVCRGGGGRGERL